MLRHLFFSFIFFIAFTTAHADVEQQLRECETHFQAKRLTSGSGGTALACYKLNSLGVVYYKLLDKHPCLLLNSYQ